VRRDHERRLRGKRGDQSGGNEKVGVHDVGTKPPRLLPRVAREGKKTKLPARAPVEHRPFDLVPAPRELALQLGNEDSEIGIARARIHLRDEQDSHLVGED